MLVLYIIIFNTIFVKKIFVLSSLIELIILNVFVYFMYKFFIQNIQLQNETFTNQLIIQELKNKEKDYHRLIKNEEKLKTIKHDMKHHLLYLLDCYENNNENFEKEIKKEIANLTKLETSVNTGVSSLDYIIHQNEKYFRKRIYNLYVITTMEISFLINWTRILYLEILLIMQLRIVQQIHQKKSLLI